MWYPLKKVSRNIFFETYYLGLLVVNLAYFSVINIITDDLPMMALDLYLRQMVSIFYNIKIYHLRWPYTNIFLFIFKYMNNIQKMKTWAHNSILNNMCRDYSKKWAQN